jgi:aryl-alcohol dehydrogenase-like predicted oxidoreductase
MTIPNILAGTANLIDDQASRQILDAAYAAGYRIFDTARVYTNGASEICIGNWLRDTNKKDISIITKCGHPSDRNRLTPGDLEQDLHDSLRALRMDCLDLTLLHRDDPAIPVATLVGFFDEKIKQGKTRAWGVSNWEHSRLLEAVDFAKANSLTGPSASSLHYSLGTWTTPPWPDCRSLSASGAAAERDWYASTQFPLYAWSSLCGGFYNDRKTSFFDKLRASKSVYDSKENRERLSRIRQLAAEKRWTVPQVVLAYLYSQPLATFPVIYSRDLEHYQQNMAATHYRLTSQECLWLNLEM